MVEIMNGVEILASNEVAIEYAFNWTAFWIVGGIVLSIITMIGVCLWANDECGFGIVPSLFVVGLCGGMILGSITGNALSKPTKYTTEYKVTVSDEVSMVEFNERYKVIDQEGKIYTVRERE